MPLIEIRVHEEAADSEVQTYTISLSVEGWQHLRNELLFLTTHEILKRTIFRLDENGQNEYTQYQIKD